MEKGPSESARNMRSNTQNEETSSKEMNDALGEVLDHSATDASQGTEENNGPPPVHTATGTDTSANAPPTGSAETDDTPRNG